MLAMTLLRHWRFADREVRSWVEKTASNMLEAIARGGRIIFLSDAESIERLGGIAAPTTELPAGDAFVPPILRTIPVQLLAYHAAVIHRNDVDQPRDLAKSVTVE
jgi:glucosamine--fructose-6-phosphate aminotransferase (isomerizing)